MIPEIIVFMQRAGIVNKHSNTYDAVMQEAKSEVSTTADLIAYRLAIVILKQAFSHFPSPTGEFGNIPSERE